MHSLQGQCPTQRGVVLLCVGVFFVLVLTEALLVSVYPRVRLAGTIPLKASVALCSRLHEGWEAWPGRVATVAANLRHLLSIHPRIFQYLHLLVRSHPPCQNQARATTRAFLTARSYHRPIPTSSIYSVNINFIPEEQDEINSASRWLRRVVHPFDSFEQILSVGLTSSALSQASNQRHERRVQLYSEQLWVFDLYLLSGHHSETNWQDVCPTRVPHRRLEPNYGAPPTHCITHHVEHDNCNGDETHCTKGAAEATTSFVRG